MNHSLPCTGQVSRTYLFAEHGAREKFGLEAFSHLSIGEVGDRILAMQKLRKLLSIKC